MCILNSKGKLLPKSTLRNQELMLDIQVVSVDLGIINRSKSFDRKLCSVLSEFTLGRDKVCLVSNARTYGRINNNKKLFTFRFLHL